MPDVTDMELVREYCARQSEPAFETLVQRHVNLVYSTALRQVGNPVQAEEITQAVFVILARKAAGLRPDAVLAAWLHETARHVAASFLRGEIRRRQREQEAYMQSTLQPSSDESVWEQLAPLLDEAIGRLRTADRNVVALRYFQNKSAHEIAAALNIGEDAAKKRLSRAVEKLRLDFCKRGINVSTAALSGAVLTHSVEAAPAALAKTATAVALAKGATASTSTLTLIKGALKIMAWTKAKTAVVAITTIIAVTGTTTLVINTSPIRTGKRAIARHIVTPVNLTAHYYAPSSGFDTISSFPAFKTIPRGFQVFDGVPLQIDGMICLWGSGVATKFGLVFPTEVVGIDVRQRFETLYVYHCGWVDSPRGTPVCDIVFRYADGSSATNQLRYGSEVINWVADSGKKPDGPTGSNSKLAWVGGSYSPNQKVPLHFCLTAIGNPQPSLEVASIDLYSCKNPTATGILAMTGGQSGVMR